MQTADHDDPDVRRSSPRPFRLGSLPGTTRMTSHNATSRTHPSRDANVKFQHALRSVRAEADRHPVVFISVREDVHGEGLSARFYADNDVSSARLEVVGFLVGNAILLFDRGCENVSAPGVDGFGVERVKYIDGRVRGVPGRDHKDLRLQCANIPVAVSIEVAMVVRDSDTDGAANFGGGRF